MFNIKKLDFLISLYIFCICVAELMGGKVFHLFKIGSFPLNASVAIFTLPIIFSINDVITEVYGKERARSVVRSGLLIVALIFLTDLLFTSLPPSKFFMKKEIAYDSIFATSARIAFASLSAFAISDFLDIYLFSIIREKYGKKALWFRNNLSNIISQLVDTVVFIFIAFYVIDKPFAANFSTLLGIILPYWLIKCFMSVIETPFVYLGVNWLKKDK